MGLHPLFHFRLKYFFLLAVIHLFGIAYLSKWLNHSETSCKMTIMGLEHRGRETHLEGAKPRF